LRVRQEKEGGKQQSRDPLVLMMILIVRDEREEGGKIFFLEGWQTLLLLFAWLCDRLREWRETLTEREWRRFRGSFKKKKKRIVFLMKINLEFSGNKINSEKEKKK